MTQALTLAPVNDDPTGTADASLIVGVEDTPYQVFEAELLQDSMISRAIHCL